MWRGRVNSRENRAVGQSRVDHSHWSDTAHTGILVGMRSTLEANLLIPACHALIPVMEQRTNSIPRRGSLVRDLLSLQQREAELLKPGYCCTHCSPVYRLAPFEVCFRVTWTGLTNQMT